MARLTEQACHLPADSIAVMSTGVIGEPMPMDKIATGINQASQQIVTEAGVRGENVAQAIMTTDLVPKVAATEVTVNGHTVRLAGMAKGSGMIEPNLATMLAVLVTDATVGKDALDSALRQAVARSFNRLTVDGDTSTNDTVLLLASGQSDAPVIESGTPGYEAFVAALTQLSTDLAQAIARDGEGATKLVEITVVGAASEAEADRAAKTVATSPLVKTAIFGADPNWGRLLMAVGRSGVQVDTDRTALKLGEFRLVEQGEPLPFDVVAANEWLAASTDVPIWIDLGVGQGEATVWTCDLSYRYVEINAEYHT
jgi:glutamate N-acetyltransferase/amino-acid N-acetyltransferase